VRQARRGFEAIAELELPEGEFVEDEDGPLIWLSHDTPDAETVERMLGRHAETGLWPVVVGDHRSRFDPPAVPGAPDHPFADHSYTKLSYASGRRDLQGRLERRDAEAWLAPHWADAVAEDDANDYWSPEEKVSAQAPLGARWPGLALAAESLAHPLAAANWFAARILAEDWLHGPRLALMPGASSGEALAASWWTPPNTGYMAARVNVLRSWEERFGARVVALKPDTLMLSVSAPPVTREHAVHVACEHLAFCPDAIWQCSLSFENHVEIILSAPIWQFWWD